MLQSKDNIHLIKDKGATNEHDILKNADVDDSDGMLKFGVDLTTSDTEDIDSALKKQLGEDK